jgi:hypothetical protein
VLFPTIEGDPQAMLARAPEDSVGVRKLTHAQLATGEAAKESDPRRTAIGIDVRTTREVAVDRNLGDGLAQLGPARLEQRARP